MSLSNLRDAGFDVETTNHASAILSQDFPDGLAEFCSTLLCFDIRCTEMLRGGGNKCPHTDRLGRMLERRGWCKRNIEITKTVDGIPKSSMTHEIDHVRDFDRGTLAAEIEWNNKDPFFDRDLENFQRLHADGAISVGIIITRGQSLQSNVRQIIVDCAKANGLNSVDDFARLNIKAPTANQVRMIERRMIDADFATVAGGMLATKYGESTTHWNKLMARLDRGVGNPCPLLLVGLPALCVKIVTDAEG